MTAAYNISKIHCFQKRLLFIWGKAVDRSLNQSEFFRPLQLHVAFLTGGLDKKQVKNFFAANCRQFKCGNVLTDYASENDKWQMFGKNLITTKNALWKSKLVLFVNKMETFNKTEIIYHRRL